MFDKYMQIPFYTQIAILDNLLKDDILKKEPEAVEVILKAIKNNVELRKHFFRKSLSSEWLPILWDKGFFTSPPPPVKSEHGSYLANWDAQEYLLSVATQYPSLVVEHILSMQVEPAYISGAIACLPRLDVQTVEKTIPRIIEWISIPDVAVSLQDTIVALITYLARENNSKAFELFDIIICPVKPSSANENVYLTSSPSVSVIGEHRFIDDDSDFHEMIKVLKAFDVHKFIYSIENALAAAISLENENRNYDRSSTSWRASIENSGQNWHHYYKDDLLDALRDTFFEIIDVDSVARPRIDYYLSQSQNGLFKRLGIYALTVDKNKYFDIARRELLSNANYNDVEIYHEFVLLLESKYQQLAKVDQVELIKHIQAGPSLEGEHSLVNSKLENRYWKLQRLWGIRQYLEGEIAKELEEIISEFGPPEHHTFLNWHSGSYWITEASPISNDDIAALTHEQLVNYLRDWYPAQIPGISPNKTTRRGLANAVANFVVNHAEHNMECLLNICRVGPVFSSAIFSQLSPRTNNDKSPIIDWDTVLNLSNNLISDDHIKFSMERDDLIGWREVRNDIVKILVSGIGDHECQMSFENILITRDLLLILANDPDPIDNDAETGDFFEKNDPHTIAHNHVRPQALSGLIEYALRVSMNSGSPPELRRLDVTVQPAIEKLLCDPNYAVHSIFGRYLNNLYWIDEEWLSKNLFAIFPEDENQIGMYVSAWDSYVVFNYSLYIPLCKLLYPHYERSVKNIKSGYVTKSHLVPSERLGAHLVLFYMESANDLEIDDHSKTLLYNFFEVAGANERRQTAWSLVYTCRVQSKAGIDVNKWWPKALSFWQHRLDFTSLQNSHKEFDKEMASFVHLLEIAPNSETLGSLWIILKNMLPYIAINSVRNEVWNSMEQFIFQHAASESILAIELYKEMYKSKPRGGSWIDATKPRYILETCAKNDESRTITLFLIDTLARAGDHRYRDIYERYAI
ncbi:MAG: hypothetical protein ABIY70_17235 [Capsulimonas sp.]|uniref:hypothetical protein n=1 Tax=Capsulimonas sp. TaxID=2494211 RepID=UPI0032664791